MDTVIEPLRELPSEAFNRATDTRDMLARAAQQRAAYNLDDAAKRNILGLNARRVFGI